MLKSIQVGRGFAALLVVLHHLGTAIASPKYFGLSNWSKPFIWGDAGVAFFFVLSGFLILWIHFDDIGHPERVIRYAKKRAVRIYPLYWMVFAVALAGALLTRSTAPTVPHDFVTIAKSLLLLPQDPAIVGGNGSPVIIVAWSLQYEVCFYVLIATFLIHRWIGAACVGLLLANWVACILGGCSFPGAFFSSLFIVLFAFGASIVWLIKLKIPLARPGILAVLAAALFVAYGMMEAIFGTHGGLVDRRLVYGVLSALLIWAVVLLDLHTPIRYPRALLLLGDSSYCLYLIHYPLISVLFKLALITGIARAGVVGALATYVASLTVCLVAALQIHRFVEQPLLQRLNSSADRLRTFGSEPSAG